MRVLYRVAMVVDAEHVAACPGVLLVEQGAIVAAGHPADIGTPQDVRVVDAPDVVLIPGLINAHAHLDLSHVEPHPFGGDFVEWIAEVRTARLADEHALARSVERGVQLALAGGTVGIGDIAGVASAVPLRVLRAGPLRGVSYREIFGLGRGEAAAVARIRTWIESEPRVDGGIALGLQPHAPYSCGPNVYDAAAASGLPLATHLAECPEEIEFTLTGQGPLRAFLETLGVWDESIATPGRHPVETIAAALARAPFIVAHCNYVNRAQIDVLTATGATVAYCPRASEYFDHPRGDAASHQYRAMLERGVPVALGTDAWSCLDTPDRISVLDEMRRLHQRDGTDPRVLLRMATTAGAAAVSIDPALVTLTPGVRPANVLAVPTDPRVSDPLAAALRRSDPPRWLMHAGIIDDAWSPAGKEVRV